jgi:CBS domain-containing protein
VDEMRKCPPSVESSAKLGEVFAKMRETHSTFLLVEKDEKIVGLVTIADILGILFDVEN